MRRASDQPGSAPRQAVWTAMRKSPDAFAGRTLAQAVNASCKTVCDYLKSLEAARFIALTCGAPAVADRQYRLIRDVGHEAPRVRRDGTTVSQGGGTEAMWRTMQVLGEFTAQDVWLHSATERRPVTADTAKAYVSSLFRAGYLVTVRKAEPVKGRQAIYRLVRRSGPKPPQVQRVKRIYDPNTGESFETEGRA